jgi:P-type Ca2+ transporter type 2C
MSEPQRFVFEACQDMTLGILIVAAAISLTLGMTTEVLCYI